MRYIDVFNGDADGMCALHQLRLADPVESELVTGLKREIDLLDRIQADPQCLVTVLDLSLDRNRAALLRVLAQGADVQYFDHHIAHDIPVHVRLRARIDSSADACTSTLVNEHLGGRFCLWAIVAAFGDGLSATAQRLAQQVMLNKDQQSKLCRLGESLNYNAYGEDEADLVIHPRELYAIVHRYIDPFVLYESEPIVRTLLDGMDKDLQSARQIAPIYQDANCCVLRLPDAAWCRRVIGTLANRLARSDAQRTYAIARAGDDATLRLSLRVARAIIPQPGDDADALCRPFGGGGRAGAAGIDRLPVERLEEFLEALRTAARRWTTQSNPSSQ